MINTRDQDTSARGCLICIIHLSFSKEMHFVDLILGTVL